MRPSALPLLALAGGLAALGGCRPPAAPAALRIAHESDVISLDPAVADDTTHSILSNLHEALVGFDRDMALVPQLAVTWSTPDDLTWQLVLRKDVRFHDGTPLTAAELKKAFDRIQGGADSPAKRQFAGVREIQVVNEHRLEFRTLSRDPLLLNRLPFVLVARESPEGSGRLVGTGPYRLVRWEQGRLLEAEAFAGYWGRRPSIKRVLFLPVQEGEQTLDVLRRGEVDVLRWVPETLAGRITSFPGVRLVTRPGLGTYYLWFNSQPGSGPGRKPFADRRVRHAVSLAVDRRAIIRRLGGIGVPAYQFVQTGIFGYAAGLPPLPFDPARARRLLGEAGYGRGFDAELTHRSAASVTAVAEAVRDMLGEVGIRVRLRNPDWAFVVREWRAGRLPFFLAGWRFDNGDALSFLTDCLRTRDAARNRGGNNPGFSSPELDRLIEEHAEIVDAGNRHRHYEKLMRVVMEDMPLVPLYTRENLYAVSERVRWEPRLDGELLAAEMSFKER